MSWFMRHDLEKVILSLWNCFLSCQMRHAQALRCCRLSNGNSHSSSPIGYHGVPQVSGAQSPLLLCMPGHAIPPRLPRGRQWAQDQSPSKGNGLQEAQSNPAPSPGSQGPHPWQPPTGPLLLSRSCCLLDSGWDIRAGHMRRDETGSHFKDEQTDV